MSACEFTDVRKSAHDRGQERASAEAELRAAGWVRSDQWWLPPSDVTRGRQGAAKCYSFRQAIDVTREMKYGDFDAPSK